MEKQVTLKIIPIAEAASRALKEVEAERSGEQHGLLTPFPSLNISAGKYFRFNNVNMFAGLSGHGKSYLLNILNNGFVDETLNYNLPFVPIILNFSFEMSSHTELLRTAAADLGVSYSHLLSSDYNKETKTYNKMTDAEMVKLKQFLAGYKNKSILYVETSSNVEIVYNTIAKVADRYLGKKNEKGEFTNTNSKGKPYRLIVNFDHTLLFEKLAEKDVLELMMNVGKLALRVRKGFNAMVNLLGQLNNNIESVLRLTNPDLHYPQKSDIYAQGQLFNACDNVYVINQPHQLRISFYGKHKVPTKNLIHLMKLKSRHGKIGSIWLKNNLANGRIEEFDIKSKKDETKNQIEEPIKKVDLNELPTFKDNN